VRTLLVAAGILLTGCAASGTGALPASSSASQAAAPLADEAEIQVAKELDLSAIAPEEQGVVCRREAPVGSRIPVMRCEPARSAATADSVAFDEQQRQDIEEMRRQRQLLLEQQRVGGFRP